MTWSQLGLQDACSPVIEEFIFFHDFAIVVLVFIIGAVGCVIGRMLFSPFVHRGLMEAQVLECIWTLVPAAILVQIAVPSLLLLYMLEEGYGDRVRVKVVGHQWYWSYEYSDLWGREGAAEFDSYMLPDDTAGGFTRLLDVDNRTVLPFGAHVRALIGAADVLHSWTVPSLGVKADACPGRLNQINFIGHRPGLFYGQCREICGANHRFMPICVELVRPADFVDWASALQQDQ